MNFHLNSLDSFKSHPKTFFFFFLQVIDTGFYLLIHFFIQLHLLYCSIFSAKFLNSCCSFLEDKFYINIAFIIIVMTHSIILGMESLSKQCFFKWS